MKRLKLLILISLGLIGLIFVFSANAQEAKVTISPVSFEMTADPGEIISNSLKVTNETDKAVILRIKVEDWQATGEEGHVLLVPDAEETYSLKRWVTAEPEEFILEPGKDRAVNFEIDVPLNAEPGGHYGSVLVQIVGGVSQEAPTGVTITQEVGAHILLAVSGEVKEELIVKDFSCGKIEEKEGQDKKEFIPLAFFEYGPIDFRIRFENQGTVHVKPVALLAITNWRNKKIADVVVPQNNVVPEAVRKIEFSWDEKWLFGPYTATLVGAYGVSNKPLEPIVITFWVIPWKMILVIAISLFIFFIFLYKTRRRWRMAMRILIRGEKGISSK